MDEQDIQLFRHAVRNVKPLTHDRVGPEHGRSPVSRRPAPIPRQRGADEQAVLREMMSDGFDPGEIETGDELYFARPGVQYSVLRKLRRGQINVTAELDLHGLFVAQARAAVAAFLHDCAKQRVYCARIIHGKGLGSQQRACSGQRPCSGQRQPVLKQKVNHWLQYHDQVLAFCSARAYDGGTGAVYVLLRRSA